MKRRIYRVRVFRTWFDSPTLTGALAIIAGLKHDYGPALIVNLIAFTETR